MAVWGRVAYGPNGAPLLAAAPLLWGGGTPWPGGGGKGPAPPWPAFSIPRLRRGGRGGERGGDGMMVPPRPPPVPWPGPPATARGVA